MANSIAKLAILLTADASGVGRVFAQAQGQVKDFSGQIASIAAQLSALAGGAAAIGWGVKLAAEAETAKVGFEVMLGSADKAAKMLGDIKKFASATPFGGADLRDAAKTMLAFGIAAEDIMPSLKMLGDVAGGNSQKLGSLALVFGQISSAGKLTGGDLLQLINVGFNPLQIMAGGSTEKYKELRKEMENGNITFQMVKDAFIKVTSEGGQFNGMMERMSQTAEGRWSTLKDQFAELALAIGEKLLPVASRMIDMTSAVLGVLQSMDAQTAESAAKLIAFGAAFGVAIVVIPKIVAAMKTLVAMYRTMTIAQSIQQALSGPKGWATLAASLVVAAGAAAAVGAMFDESNKAIAKTSKEAAKAADATKKIGGGAPIEFPTTDKDAAKKAKEAAKEAKKELTEMKNLAESISEKMRTPFEKFADQAGLLKDLLDNNMISAETYSRAMAKARDDVQEQAKSVKEIRESLNKQNAPVAALQFGTQQAITATSAVAREQKNDAEARRQFAAKQDKTNEILTKIEKAVSKKESINFNEVQL